MDWWNRQATVAQACMVIAAVAVVALLVVRGGGGPHGQTSAEKTFLADLSVRGDDSEADRLQLGKDICHMLRAGESPGAASRYFGTTDPLALAVQLSGSLTAATAPGSLCPDQAAAVNRWVGQ